MVFFTIKGKKGEYPYIVLKGKHFYLKAQELIFGKNKFREFATLNEKLNDLTVEVLEIDIEPEDINRTLSKYFSSHSTVNTFSPVYESTIKKSYEKCYMKQSFDFYQNLSYNIGTEKLNRIIYLVIYKNVSKGWISAYFNLGMSEVDFILDYLPVYYNYLTLR